MAQQLLHLDARGFDHAQRVFAIYLPGLDPGLVPLAGDRALIAATTLRALSLEYGAAGLRGVLHAAGVTRHEPIGDVDALGRMLEREPAALPARAAAPALARLWHLDETNVRPAWAHFGGPLAIAWGDVRVGQIDTGYTAHPAFGFPATTWIDAAGGRTFFAEGADGSGPGPGGGVDPVQRQMDGHGTRVGSVIAGFDPAAPSGDYFGIAPRVPLVPVRIADHVLISHAQRELAQALDHLVAEALVGVVNLSMGFLPRFQIGAVDRAIDRAYEAGVIFVCAAGQPLASVISPAHGRRTIAVAGSTVGSKPWGKSAFGPAVDWTAPADLIERANTPLGGGAMGYAGNGDGTSYAAAITTGAAALWLARHGSAALAARYPQPWQRIEAFKAVAKATARLMPNQQPGSFGAGILDIGRLLQEPLPAAAALQKEAPA